MILWPVFLYAETHYSFKGIHSRLKKKEPEILADAPHRVEPGHELPILILIKDAHLYPVQLNKILVELNQENRRKNYVFPFNHLMIETNWWYEILKIPRNHFSGNVLVNVKIEYTVQGKLRLINNDNYAGTSHNPLQVYFARMPLPKKAGWYFGEFHCHTAYTSDQVEFGAPLKATAILARALGLNFFCATDHSYDLDDLPDNYLKNDSELRKWRQFLNEVESLNRHSKDFIIIPGEEVSAGNAQNRNVHLLILNHRQFIPGDGDGAERWFRTRPALSIAEILDQLENHALAFAAHPEIRAPFLQWLLIRRGKWREIDYQHPRLNGLQIWNGSKEGLEEGLKSWIKLLLSGRKIFICGGNDAHGNFNRFRQIGLPFFTMRENFLHLFGKVRTGIHIADRLCLNNIIEAMQKGHMIVTNGPFMDITLFNQSGQQATIGQTLPGNQFKLKIECLSSEEFGPLTKLKIYFGDLSKQEEELFLEHKNFKELYHYFIEKNFLLPAQKCYLRAELESFNGTEFFYCYTNPIWVECA